jgi:hypothetical protein
MEDRKARRKATPTRKAQQEQTGFGPTTQQAVSPRGTRQNTGGPTSPSRLEKAISELQGLNDLLLSGDLDARILTDFRDALNRVRNAAWAAQQYVVRKETDQGSSSVLSLLAGERIRTTYQLCLVISEDLKRTDIELQAGSLVQLYEVMSALTEQLKGVVKGLG